MVNIVFLTFCPQLLQLLVLNISQNLLRYFHRQTYFFFHIGTSHLKLFIIDLRRFKFLNKVYSIFWYLITQSQGRSRKLRIKSCIFHHFDYFWKTYLAYWTYWKVHFHENKVQVLPWPPEFKFCSYAPGESRNFV